MLHKTLYCDSPFHELAQAAINRYYLIPYPGVADVRPHKVNRIFHGGVHVSSTVNNLEICIELYKKYAPDLLSHNGPLTEQQIKLLKLAAIYHDAANVNDAHGEGHEHAQIFRKDMLALGFNAKDVEDITNAILNKDNRQKKRIFSLEEKKMQVLQKNIYQKLLQSADCLDVIRVVRQLFDQKQLDIYHDLITRNSDQFPWELNSLINNLQMFLDNFNLITQQVTEAHKLCEFAPNCYLAVKRFYELYTDPMNTCKPTELVKKILNEQIHCESVIDAYQNGLIVRTIQDLQKEFDTFKMNNATRAEHQLTSIDSLKSYFREQEESYTQVFAPPGFEWRPATFIKANIPISLYGAKSDKQRAFVILLPNDPLTQCVWFYKKNVISNSAKSGNFTYGRTIVGRAKDKQNIESLSSKLDEMNQRRIGALPDPGLHYFGKPEVETGEILLSNYENIAGIGILGFNQHSAESALKIATQYGRDNIRFYRYITEQGFAEISRDEVLAQATNHLNSNDMVISTPDFNLDKKDIKNVRKVTNTSEQGTLTFEFEVSQMPIKAFIKNGMPILEVSKPGGGQFTINTTLLPFIAETYYREQLQRLPVFSNSQPSIHFDLINKNGKLLFVVKVKTTQAVNKYDHTLLTQHLSQYGKFTVSNFPPDPQEIVLTTTNINLIEQLNCSNVSAHFSNTIMDYIQQGIYSPKKPTVQKIAGSKYQRMEVALNNNNNNNNYNYNNNYNNNYKKAKVDNELCSTLQAVSDPTKSSKCHPSEEDADVAGVTATLPNQQGPNGTGVVMNQINMNMGDPSNAPITQHGLFKQNIRRSGEEGGKDSDEEANSDFKKAW